MNDPRARIGWLGERVAERVLVRHGLRVAARNVVVGGGEIDIIAYDKGRRVVVEVRTVTGSGEPLEAFDAEKAARVARLARLVEANRVDLVAIRLGRSAAEVRWVRSAA